MMQLAGVPLTTRILTQQGWKGAGEVQRGDFTLGLNCERETTEWTPIRNVLRHSATTIRRIGNGSWHADVSEAQPWWSETRRKVPVPRDSLCPVCDRVFTSPRGYQVHMTKMHGSMRGSTGYHYVGELVRTSDLNSEHRLRLSAPADTTAKRSLSPADAQLIAWLWGDGSLRESERAGAYDGSIFQSKTAQIEKLRILLKDIPHSEFSRQRNVGHLRAHHFRLRRAYVTDLVERSGIALTSPEMFVLGLSRIQRSAWLEAMIDAEGHRMPGKEANWSEYIRIVQVNGPVQDAIRLAAFLHGYRPTFSANSAEKMGFKPAGAVGLAQPFVAPSIFTIDEVIGHEQAWSVETTLGTWVGRQGNHLMLLGSPLP